MAAERGNASADKKTEGEEIYGIGCQEKDHRHETQRLDSYDTQADNCLQETLAKRHLPMSNPFFVCQELIDVPAVRPKEVLAILDTQCHGGQFVCIKREKEARKTNEIEQVLPKTAQGGNR
jgi:hypothetical protein